MSYKVEVSQTATFQVKIICESCGSEYESKAAIVAERTLLDEFSQHGLKPKLDRKIAKFRNNDFSELPPLPCPKCGYFQSWNHAGKQKEVAENISVIAALVISLPVFISMVKDNFFAALILFGLSAGVLMAILKPILTAIMKNVYNPNKKREAADKTIYPTILN